MEKTKYEIVRFRYAFPYLHLFTTANGCTYYVQATSLRTTRLYVLFFIEIVSRGCSEEPHPLVHVDVAFGIPSCAERNGRTQRGWRSKQPKSDCSSLRTAISPVDSSSVSGSLWPFVLQLFALRTPRKLIYFGVANVGFGASTVSV